MIDKHNEVLIHIGGNTSDGGGTKIERKFSVDENGNQKKIEEVIADEL